jgi:FAD/FMN-containing dehydrogenase
MSIRENAFEQLSASFAGTLLRPADAGYDEARSVHNGLIDKRPALIARCAGTDDVIATLAYAQGEGLPISVRGGGHGLAGLAVADGGVTIDLSAMREVSVDPAEGTATVQGGATWGEYNDATAEHGLASTGGVVSTTGVGGLTLGGGLGWLMGKHGLAVDNLRSVDLVTAAGEALTVSADAYPDLFWALRGAGANFGVATSFEFQLHPLGEVYGGLVAHPFDAARDVLRAYRDFCSTLPDELTVYAGLVHAPDGSGMPLAALVICHAGARERAERDLDPLVSYGSPALSQVGPMPYPAVNQMLDAGYPRGALNYWKSSFLQDLGDDAIDAMVEGFASCPSPMTAIVIENFHGAVTRVPVSETAVRHREPGYNVAITSVWTDPESTEENMKWTRDLYASLEPSFVSRRYVNYLNEDDPGAIRAAYGPNLDRLAEVKRTYDPTNRFRSNHNIDPAES